VSLQRIRAYWHLVALNEESGTIHYTTLSVAENRSIDKRSNSGNLVLLWANRMLQLADEHARRAQVGVPESR